MVVPIDPGIDPIIDPDPAIVEIDAIQEQIVIVEQQINDLVYSQQSVKAEKWVIEIAADLPKVVTTSRGIITIESVYQDGNSVVFNGTSDYLGKDFWPWTVVNPPLNPTPDKQVDVTQALTATADALAEDVIAANPVEDVPVDPGP